MTNLGRKLLSHLEERGTQGRIVAARRAHDLEQDIETLKQQRLFDGAFVQERLSELSFEPPDTLRDAQSLVVVAVPSPQVRVTFLWEGERRVLILPPTYAGYERIQREIESLVASFLEPAGFQVRRAGLPLKLLAVRSGLGEYGRNNICYVPGMGSFHELVALYSELPAGEEDASSSWQGPRMMARCETCLACQRSCPTGAIPTDRFLLRAERCLTYHNEQPAEVPFPEWIDPIWHNCMIGCMECQRICPENKPYVGRLEGEVEFSEEETELLLAGIPFGGWPSQTAEKWRRLELSESPDLQPRNLAVHLKRA